MNALDAVRAWRHFAKATNVEWSGRYRSWADHIRNARGYRDEEQLLQPHVFPRFAEALLGFEVGRNLAPERYGREGKPDFTPADSVTHPFIFETKSSIDGISLSGYEAQIDRYLHEGRPRIKQVVLTNLVGIRVFRLGDTNRVTEEYSVNLRGLLEGDEQTIATIPDASRFAQFLADFSFRELTLSQKLDQVRQQPPWNPVIEATDSQWISNRLDRVVQVLARDVSTRVRNGTLTDETSVLPEEREGIVEELRELEWRLGLSVNLTREHDLETYVASRETSPAGKALAQYCAHVAYFTATRLLLVRIWEDLGLLDPVLHDGGFDKWMSRFDDVIGHVVEYSFTQASGRYRALFDRRNNYTWYKPSDDAHIEVIYELANTFLGEIASDVLGEVYERLLERVDRKILGQYYTPRDIIALIWDLIDLDVLADQAENQGRVPRVLDIATGSGGFLVEAAHRLRLRMEQQIDAGASVDRQSWMGVVANSLTGVEIQRFPAYLAELNLLIQLGQTLVQNRHYRLPPLGILPTDSLSLHNPHTLFEEEGSDYESELLIYSEDRRQRASRLKDPLSQNYLMDIACGNPPYVGENRAAPLISRTQERYPYWRHYAGHHMDYLYWFLILGISKLREGGRFGFITTEYWLRAIGAKALREYLAKRCRIERIVLFRDFRLFPDAPGQHSMIIIGERTVPPDGNFQSDIHNPGQDRPMVTVYRGPHPQVHTDRAAVLQAMREGRSIHRLQSYRSVFSPNVLGAGSWAKLCMTPEQVKQREQFRQSIVTLEINPEQGMQSNADSMGRDYHTYLSTGVLREIGWPERKAGIFVLNRDEVEGLGNLTDVERQVLRPTINTKDLYPYAAVPPADGPVLLYLQGPDDIGHAGHGQALYLPFPVNMPNLNRHLERFRPLLERKVTQYSEENKRPWWSIHRPKPRISARDHGRGKWADYCVTARWGAGQKLIVGMAPQRSAPLSGIYALLTSEDVPGAYACGVLNATAVQQLAETLPPGVIRSHDLEEIGVPYLPTHVELIASAATSLADLVQEFIRIYSHRFPALPDTIREDAALPVVPTNAWQPDIGPLTSWGKLRDVGWTDELVSRGSRTEPIQDVRIQHDLLGLVVHVVGRVTASVSVHLADGDEGTAQALLAYICGLASTGGTLQDVPELLVPVLPQNLVSRYQEDQQQVNEAVERYRSLRAEIDAVVDAVI